MQNAPDIEFRLPLGVEDKVREPPDRPETKAGNAQLMGVTGRTALRLLTDLAEDAFEGVDEGKRDCLSRLGQIVINGLIDITFRPFAQDNRFCHSMLTGCANSTAEMIEVVRVSRTRQRGFRPLEKQVAESLAVLIPADQFADIFAGGTVAPRADLIVHEGLERIGKRDVHRCHSADPIGFGKIWQERPSGFDAHIQEHLPVTPPLDELVNVT